MINKREVISFLVGSALMGLMLVVWFKSVVIPNAECRAFRIGYRQYEVYNADMKDKIWREHPDQFDDLRCTTFSKGWEYWEIDSILACQR